jgi:hypothetical protein
MALAVPAPPPWPPAREPGWIRRRLPPPRRLAADGAAAERKCGLQSMTWLMRSSKMESSLILVVIGSPLPPWEPGTGANARRLPPTGRDALRALAQVRGSPTDSFRPSQTGRS